ncbi:FUSC family protein [Streptomyces sp. NPDC056161]|uniref:FUSC family protein n=1 Tax=Streptomyces sp. NPDC056161 TaxID=3345732 RepID=UPI0035D6B133
MTDPQEAGRPPVGRVPRRSARIPWDRTLRGAIAMGWSVGLALLTQVDASTALVVGGLSAINGDHSGPRQARLARLGAVAVGGTAGITLGTLVHHSGWPQVLAMTTAALLAAVAAAEGPVGQLGGVKLMLLTAIGVGMNGAAPAWQSGLLFLLGLAPMALLLLPAFLARPARIAPARIAPVRRLARVRRPRVPWLDVARLTACVGTAALVANLVHPAYAHWLPLTAIMICRLDRAEQTSRLKHRAAGTALGALMVLAVAAAAPHGWELLLLALVVGTVLPGATDAAYTFHTGLVTVIVLVLADPTVATPPVALRARVADTAVAALIVALFTIDWWSLGRGRHAAGRGGGPADANAAN